jgi:hypothetical protein
MGIFSGIIAQETPSPTTNPESKVTFQGKPLKNEQGDVSVDPNVDSIRLRDLSLSLIKKVKVTLENDNKKDLLVHYSDAFAEAATLYQKGNYIESRRAYQALVNLIEDNSAKQVERYKEIYAKYTQIAMKTLVDVKLNKESGFVNLERGVNHKLQSAGLSYNDGIALAIRTKNTESLYHFKNGIKEIFEAMILIERDKIGELTLKQKKEKGLILPEHYLPKEYYKDFDDANENNHEKKSKERDELKLPKKEVSKPNLESEKKEESPIKENPPKE